MNGSVKTKKLKGQMALKSSPFNPSSGKLVAQHLILDHMSAHYKKLLNAKSAIDASVPKSYTKSQIVRDREFRTQSLDSPKKPSSRPNSARSASKNIQTWRPSSARSYKAETLAFSEDDFDGFTADEINRISTLVNDTIDSEQIDKVLQRDLILNRTGKNTARSASLTNGVNPSKGMMESLSFDTSRRKKMSADILDKREHVFTPGNEFTPRLVSNSKYKDIPSRLKSTKHFRPAKKQSSNMNDEVDAMHDSDKEVMDETIMSQDFTTRLQMAGNVPRLDISIDQDHMKWLHEQSTLQKSSRDPPAETERSGPTKQIYEPKNSHTKRKIQKEDEELLYLNFISEVTNDVLTRGIFTNRVLDKVFEDHILKNKGRLSEPRMRSMIDSLREDLGIIVDDSSKSDDVGMGSRRPELRSRSKLTGYSGNPTDFKNIRLGPFNTHASQDSESDQDDTSAGYSNVQSYTVDEVGFPLKNVPELSERSTSVSSKKSHQAPSLKNEGEDNKNSLVDLPVDEVDFTLKNAPILSERSVSVSSKKSNEASSLKKKSDSRKSSLLDLLGLEDVQTSDTKAESQRKDSKTADSKTPENLSEDEGSVCSGKSEGFVKEKLSASGSTGKAGSPTDLKDEDNDELESNLDFGKTTQFKKTGGFQLTYKALSQGSDEEGYEDSQEVRENTGDEEDF